MQKMKRPRDKNISEHICNYKPVKTNLNTFICIECTNIHQCGRDECDSLIYNSDHIRVCLITGMCFERRLCESYVDDSRAFTDNDPKFTKKTKRDQQIKNKILDRACVLKIIKCVADLMELDEKRNEMLCSKVLTLWVNFVANISKRKQYIHRKDKRCFVVAIVMSLVNGIKNNNDEFIVLPHDNIKRIKLNKKTKYNEFDVSDIRYGQNLIKDGFRGMKINPSAVVCIQ